eukprot:g15991.t1
MGYSSEGRCRLDGLNGLFPPMKGFSDTTTRPRPRTCSRSTSASSPPKSSSSSRRSTASSFSLAAATAAALRFLGRAAIPHRLPVTLSACPRSRSVRKCRGQGLSNSVETDGQHFR